VLSVLSFNASPNAVYSARAIVCHLISAAVSQTTVNQVSQSNSKAATEGVIRYRLRKLDFEGAQCSVNQMLKGKAIKTLPRRALNEVADARFSVKGALSRQAVLHSGRHKLSSG